MYIRKEVLQIAHLILVKLWFMEFFFFFSFQDNAYGKTLRQHHGWVVRGVFAVSNPPAS